MTSHEKLHIAVLGANGQLGQCLRDTLPSTFLNVMFFSSKQCDVANKESLESALGEVQLDYVINCAAYTAVDKAEDEPEKAERVNGTAVKLLSETCGPEARLIHISTDFVFDGRSRRPYLSSDATEPLGVYGTSKLAGERNAATYWSERAMVIRTSWLYSEYGGNFVKTMLRLMSERLILNVVNDQYGCPTYARSLADIIWMVIVQSRFSSGVYHWSDEGEITWHEFALEIYKQGRRLKLLSGEVEIEGIPTSEYPTPAKRPAYSVLDCSELEEQLSQKSKPWQSQLTEMLSRLT